MDAAGMNLETIVDVRNRGKTIQVFRSHEEYLVVVDNITRHSKCTAEDVIRALATYLHDES